MMAIGEFIETEITITLDSGCVDHLADMADIPGYACVLESSPGSRRGQRYIVGDGGKVKNEGQVRLQMTTTDGSSKDLCSVFQVAEITRPLMSVSRICDQDLDCWFSKKFAKILDSDGKVLAVFERVGGLYEAKMKLRAPKPLETTDTSGKVDPSTFARPAR